MDDISLTLVMSCIMAEDVLSTCTCVQVDTKEQMKGPASELVYMQGSIFLLNSKTLLLFWCTPTLRINTTE